MSKPVKLLPDHLADLRKLAADPRQRFPTGFPTLDLILDGGPAAGEVCYFIGRSFTGKSLIATNIMANNPHQGLIFFSLEMPAHQVYTRLFSHVTDIPGREVVRMVKRNEMVDAWNYALDPFERQLVVDEASLTLGDMKVYVEWYVSTFGELPGCVIIDYLEEIGGGKAKTGDSTAEATASALKAWAKEMSVPVFVLHQTNRNVPTYMPPNEDSARYAGFTQADAVCGIWRPGNNPEIGPLEHEARRDELSMNVLKNRINGRQTDEIVYRLSPSMRLVDVHAKKNAEFWRE